MSDVVSNGGHIAHECGPINAKMHLTVGSLEKVGARLRAERESLGLNQEDFGQIGAITRNSQAAYEAGRRACDADYLTKLSGAGVDVGYVLTGERSSGKLSPDVAEYAGLSPRIGDEAKAALLTIARSIARNGAAAPAVTPQPIALPPEDALERGYLGLLMASRHMDEDALARELARRLPTMLGVLRGPLTIERDGDGAAEAPPTVRPGRRRA